MASIVLSSNSFSPGGQIPPEFKSNLLCGEFNRSPHFRWDLYGFTSSHCLWFALLVESTTTPGNSPNNKFLHWGVRYISTSQQEIAEDGGWLGSPTIFPSDYGSGDRVNGWHGPCAQTGVETFRCILYAKIDPKYANYVFPDPDTRPDNDILASDPLYFTDQPGNLSEDPQTGDCNTLICPPGYELVNGICQQVVISPATLNHTIYRTTDKTDPIWGVDGTIFYEDADQHVLPLRDGADAILEENDGAGGDVPYTTITDTTNTLWTNPGGFQGRMNSLGIWTDNSLGDPVDEWIGFSRCINVSTTDKYCIGIAADGMMRVKLNGDIIARWDDGPYQQHYTWWHVIELTLNEGNNIIEVEVYNNAPPAGFAFEIYHATVAQLKALTSTTELTSSGYVLYTSRDGSMMEFNIGEDSGYTCPEGFSYDMCNVEGCVDINYREAELVKCCWVLQDCRNPNHTLLAQFETGETIYVNNIYHLSGSPSLDDVAGNPICWRVVEQVVCEAPDVIGITVVQDYGMEACSACLGLVRFQSCGNPAEYLNVTLAESLTLVENNVYNLSIGDGCYIYIGPGNSGSIDAYNVIIENDYSTDNCNVCGGCLEFENCETGVTIIVQLAEGQDFPDDDDESDIYELAGDPVLINQCWRFTQYIDCTNPDYTEVTIEVHHDCQYCESCYPYYLLTNCRDPQDTMYIHWSKEEQPLDPDIAYVFDFTPNPDACYTAVLQYPPCESDTYTIYDSSNITDSYNGGCDECIQDCYKVIDCISGEEVQFINQNNFQVYVGRVIQWHLESDPEGIVRCGRVELFICREEEVLTVDGILDGCYDICENCYPTEPEEPPFIRPNRAVTPGYNVPDCTTGSPIDPCEDSCNTE